MKKIDQRTFILIFLGLTLLAMLALSASISGVKLNDGQAYSLGQLMPDLANNGPGTTDTTLLQNILRVMFIILWAMVPFYIIYLILSPAARKQFLKDLARLLPFMILMLILLNALQQNAKNAKQSEAEIQGQSKNPAQVTNTDLPPLPPQPGVSETAIIVAIIGTAVIATGGIVGAIFLFWRTRQRKLYELKPLKKMAVQAQSAIDSIRTGGDLRDVILRSYIEMTKTVAEARNLTRSNAMTPHEFETYLQEKGIPREPVHQLTQLFELVRYGGHKPGHQDEATAIASLTAIVNSVQREQRR